MNSRQTDDELMRLRPRRTSTSRITSYSSSPRDGNASSSSSRAPDDDDDEPGAIGRGRGAGGIASGAVASESRHARVPTQSSDNPASSAATHPDLDPSSEQPELRTAHPRSVSSPGRASSVRGAASSPSPPASAFRDLPWRTDCRASGSDFCAPAWGIAVPSSRDDDDGAGGLGRQESSAMAVLQSHSQVATSVVSTQGAALGSTQVTNSQNLDTHIALVKRPTPRIKRDGDFKDLVTQSTTFADKSLFIKDIIEDSDTVLLLAMPRRWGKTVNLDMLRRFLETPVDGNGTVIDETVTINYQIFWKEYVLQPDGGKSDSLETPVDGNGKVIDETVTINYQIFSREYALQPDGGKSLLKISQSKILVQNSEDVFCWQEVDALKLQGTYPVIYIDFKNCVSDRFDTVREGVKRVLNSCFKQHRYLEKSDNLDEEEKEKIKRYVGAISSEGLNDDQIKSGLQFLSEMLYQHYDKKKVWILIDEYDAMANVAYRKFNTDDLDKTIELFTGIYQNALKGNPCLEKGVLTGVQYIARSGMLSGLNNLGKFNFTDAKYAQYYGLDQGEVDLFFGHFQVPKPLGDKAKSWYNGYQVQKYNGNSVTSSQELVSKYNIWSIVSYLKRGEFSCFKSHWEESGNIDFLGELLSKPKVREKVEELIDGRCISFDRKDDFSSNDFNQLKNMISGSKEITSDGLAVLFSYLFIGGYLTIDGPIQNAYRLPNMEIMYEMGKRLIKHYQHICTIDPAKIQSATYVLQDIMSTPHRERMQEHFKNFYDRFKEVICTVRLVDDKNAEGVFANEDIVHSLLNYIALQTQHTTLGSELYTTKLHSKQKGRADIKITHKDVGVIMEIKCVPVSDRSDSHMKEALEQAMSYGNLLDTNKNLFIAINVERGTRTSEERSIEFLCASFMSDGQHVFGINASGDYDTFGVNNSIMKGFTEHVK
eukprot:CAMPEP_0171447556 /NCGR_PEP_ID=MMETSP0881-20121228/39166_1 /TAXON_ID=67004 /ORGANISM="Thalassiosira weissflogii, Strain CCMP1336" /LENGTH=936 /DNA_ID=CAMNT_0011971969 /DNA_START=135 /DNA_END=2944 /DNA_ORIENTATION=-